MPGRDGIESEAGQRKKQEADQKGKLSYLGVIHDTPLPLRH
jgi:hypothetical protein